MKCLLVIAVSFSFCSAKTLPSYIKKCKRADPVPELSKCITERAIALKPYLVKGIPEMKLPSIDPLYVPKLEIQTASSPAFSFSANLTDIKAYGGKDFQVKELNFDLENKKILLHFTFPKLYVELLYRFNGKILLFELDSSGKGYANVTDIESKSVTNVSLETRNGKEYIIIQEDPSSYIKYAHSELYFEDLFVSNKEFTERINKAINENTEALGAEVDPLIYESARLLVLRIINTVFGNYSIDELFD